RTLTRNDALRSSFVEDRQEHRRELLPPPAGERGGRQRVGLRGEELLEVAAAGEDGRRQRETFGAHPRGVDEAVEQDAAALVAGAADAGWRQLVGGQALRLVHDAEQRVGPPLRPARGGGRGVAPGRRSR